MSLGRPLIVIKLGGGLITKKDELCVPDMIALEDMASVIARVHQEGMDVIVVHGAGSFGHLKAKAWNLHMGEQLQSAPSQTFGLHSQAEAVTSVQQDMKQLNQIVCDVLETKGLATRRHSPHELFRGNGIQFSGEIAQEFVGRYHDRAIDVTYGDIVSCEDERKFAVLSGDDLMYRISTEVGAVTKVVFAIDGVDGLLEYPPIPGQPQKLIKEWREGDGFQGCHNQTIDVTGGIFLKTTRAAQIVARTNIPVLLVRGTHERVWTACTEDKCYGTLIIPKQ